MQREREIGIRVAVGAPAAKIVWLITTRVFAMVLIGAMIGLLVAWGSARYVAALTVPSQNQRSFCTYCPYSDIVNCHTLLAVLPAVRRAVATDPRVALCAE